MSETPEPTTESTSAAHEPAESTKPTKLRRALTWAGIIAGAAVVVAAIFVSGAATAWLSGGHGQPRHEAACMMDMKGMNAMKDMPKGPMPGDKDCCGKKGPTDTDCCEPKKA
jgi:predicted phage tail protein